MVQGVLEGVVFAVFNGNTDMWNFYHLKCCQSNLPVQVSSLMVEMSSECEASSSHNNILYQVLEIKLY